VADADKAHKVGGKLIIGKPARPMRTALTSIDATFAPPPLQAPFDHGADCIMHSATKYFFGHSDALGGALAVRTQEEWQKVR
jgi:cystathionine gamma-synthase